MTPERIAEIKARASAATPGHWSQDALYVVAEVPTGRPGGEVIIQCRETVGRRLPINHKCNAAFIAAARTDVPDLLDALTAANAELARLTGDSAALREQSPCSKALEYRDGVTCSSTRLDGVCHNHQVIAGLRQHGVDADRFELALEAARQALLDIREHTPTLYAFARSNEALIALDEAK